LSFSALLEEAEEEPVEAGETTRWVAEAVFHEERVVSDEIVHRPAKSDEQVAAEYWTDIGYPTPASRF
jgi:hypothetical protein